MALLPILAFFFISAGPALFTLQLLRSLVTRLACRPGAPPQPEIQFVPVSTDPGCEQDSAAGIKPSEHK